MDGWKVPRWSRSGLDRGFLMDVGPTRTTVRNWIASSAISTAANEEVRLARPPRRHRSVKTRIRLGATAGSAVTRLTLRVRDHERRLVMLSPDPRRRHRISLGRKLAQQARPRTYAHVG